MRHLHRGTPPVLLALVCMLATPLVAQTERHTLQGSDVAVYNLAGAIRVEPAGGAAVVVEVTRGGAEAARLRVVTGELRGRQTLRLIYPADVIAYPAGSGTSDLRVRDDGTFGDPDGWRREGRRVRISRREDGFEAHADIRVGVPRGQKIAVYRGVGRVTVTNVEGELRVDVASADVTAEKTRGTLVIDTGSGDVTATDVEGEVSLDTGSGNVTVTRMRGASYQLSAFSFQLSAISYQLSAISFQLSAFSYQLSAFSDQLSAVSLGARAGGCGILIQAAR